MKVDEAKKMILAELAEIAPEGDYENLGEKADLREALDLDSMDFLNFVIALSKKSGKPIPESDYPELFTLAKAIDYLLR